MDNHLVKTEIAVQRLALIALAIGFVALLAIAGVHLIEVSDPYVQQVFALQGDSTRGHAIFQMNCSGCHGLEAQGKVGPSLTEVSRRKSRVSLIHQVISGDTPPMPQFRPNPQDMADLLRYLESL